ncbi:MAG: riboflavin biosynthesis protein RibF [Bacteroidota bacterium]
MLIWRNFDEAKAGLGGRQVALTIGTFDGVHLGHRQIIGELCRQAKARHLSSLVMTFANHPAAHVTDAAPPLLIPLAQRLDLLADLGVEAALVASFDADLAGLDARTFVLGRLCRDLQAKVIVVGHDFRFGAGGLGNAEVLAALGAGEGAFDVVRVPPVACEGTVVSSTAVRWALTAGDVVSAAKLLGRPFSVRGTIATGAGRGRKLGFPTANLTLAPGSLWPRYGVYLVRISLGEGQYHGVANVGVKPTFGRSEPVIEVFILGYGGDLYGKSIEVAFLAFIRPEKRFPDAEALRHQIEADIRQAEAIAGSMGGLR